MATTLQERLQNAAISLQENRLADSISEYSAALEEADSIQQQIDLNKVLGRLYQKAKRPAEAISAFTSALEMYEKKGVPVNGADKAAVHNNLASVLLSSDLTEAVNQYRKALAIYKILSADEQNAYRAHLANTHFALAEAHLQKEEIKQAKTHFKEAIRIYDNASDLAELRARAHYQLGLIYTEEFNLHDAKLQYTKALSTYDSMTGSDDFQNRAVRAALYNNLGVTYNSLEDRHKAIDAYEKSLHLYRELIDTHAEVFLPYEASTLSSLAIAYSEMKEMQKAIEFMQESIDRYHSLADTHPDQYTHYLATSLHNQGLFYFEDRNLKRAEHFFAEALALRRKIAAGQPDLFAPDVCATALNLVELYRIYLESTLDTSNKDKGLQLLQEVRDLLDSLEDDRLVLKNMRADCASHLEYFGEIDLEELTLQYVKSASDSLRDEMHGTRDPAEKLIFQKELTTLIDQKYAVYRENKELRQNLALAHNDMAWLLLRLDKVKEARTHIEKGLQLEPDLNVLLCNQAHCVLLEKNADLAISLYSEFLKSDPENPIGLRDILRSDLDVLQKEVLRGNFIDEIRGELSV